ncbi:uncharacterized protein [Lepeophtheirus salmonis]|uniref:uncharacterized protein isoform X2 n=1 Tax=Lepeophtheirus salmonis TaxID=72036 RepID=UPI003AF3FC01
MCILYNIRYPKEFEVRNPKNNIGEAHFVPQIIFKKNVPNNPFYNIFSHRNNESVKKEEYDPYQINSTEKRLPRIQKSIKNNMSTIRNSPLKATLLSSHDTLIQIETNKKPLLRFEDLEPLDTSGSLFGTLFPNCSKIISAAGTPCIFPFSFYTKTFYHCTNENDFDDISHPLWCSTKTDSQGHHIGAQGHWGNCDPKCNFFIFLANMIFDQATQTIDCPIESCINYNHCSPFVNKMHDIQATYNTKDVFKLSNYVCDKKEYKVCCSSPNKSLERTKETVTTPTVIASSTFSVEYLDTLRPIVLTLNESKIIDTQLSSDGRWLPSPKNLECSRDISFQTGFIVGGKQTRIGEFPHTVLLGYFIEAYNATYYLCGGTLINRKYVLTAAHCHNPLNPDESIIEVVIGEWDVTKDPDCLDCKPAQRFKIENGNVIRHDQWSFDTFLTVGNDIALIRLPQTVETFVENINMLVLPACLDWRNLDDTISFNDVSEESFIVTGWGKTTNDQKKQTQTMPNTVFHRADLFKQTFNSFRSLNARILGSIKAFLIITFASTVMKIVIHVKETREEE